MFNTTENLFRNFGGGGAKNKLINFKFIFLFSIRNKKIIHLKTFLSFFKFFEKF